LKHRAGTPSSVRVGGLDRVELLRALREQNVQLNQAAESLFDDHRFTTRRHAEVIHISAVSVGDLGFDAGATYAQLIARALEAGLVECPLELGPHLRLQFLDQPEGAHGKPTVHGAAPPGSITVTSPALDDRDETPKGFYLRRVDGSLWLRGHWFSPDHIWSPDDVLVFSRVSAA
jgi:hypothetical protein